MRSAKIYFKSHRGIEQATILHRYDNIIHVQVMNAFDDFIKKEQIITGHRLGSNYDKKRT